MAAGQQPPQQDPEELASDSMWSRTRLGRFLRSKLHVASDFLGWNAGALLYLTQNLNTRAYRGMVAWFQLILSGAIDAPELMAVLRRSRGHILIKSGGGLRAIGVVPWWMQVPSCLELRASMDRILQEVGPQNVALGVPGGSEALARAVQLYLDEHPTAVAMATDCTAAFPSILRERILEAGKLLPSLAGNVVLHYGGPNTITFVGALADLDNVNITKGGNTGCAKLPALFTIAVQSALRQVRANHPRVRIVGQMDDHTLLGELADVIAAFLEMRTVFRVVLGLELNAAKGAVVGGSLFAPSEDHLSRLEALQIPVVQGIKIGGVPIGTPAFVVSFLDAKFAKFDALASRLEAVAQDSDSAIAWQALFGVVSHCVAPSFRHLARSVLPSLFLPFAQRFDERLTTLALRAAGHWQAAADVTSAEARLRDRIVRLPAAWGGLGVQSLASAVDAAFVGAAALIGPAVKGLVAETNFAADGDFKRELIDALERLQPAISHPQPPEFVEAEGEEDPEDDHRPTIEALRALSVDTIYDSSRRRVQAALASKVACVEAVAVRAALLEAGDVAGAARFVDRWQQGASAWLQASRKDARQQLKNAHFRVAVGLLLGINCFPDVQQETPCPRCPNVVGPHLQRHMLRCKAVYTGGNNRRHNAVQQELLHWFRAAGANVVCTPGVTAFTGSEPANADHAGRMVDLGVCGLDDGAVIAVDLCVSDCGTGSPPRKYKSGAKSETKGREKRRKYRQRFPAIPENQLCCPSYGVTGSKNKEAIVMQKRIINALAAADTTVHRSVVAARVNQAISVAVQRAVAFNILEYRYTSLPKGRLPVRAHAEPGGADWDDDEPEAASAEEGGQGGGEPVQAAEALSEGAAEAGPGGDIAVPSGMGH